ncbi:hypothetical protein CesoFtcFv8_019188 [Champsocephalus esox]|uniref:Uncharacterized protein n=1 Tax=Champsocephalus esox TaxID=159716 RepID=A0AAN8GN13_9TELE|nr:hypothetical protein CesoFtcFv8_019188 [Champsocephalus esox]
MKEEERRRRRRRRRRRGGGGGGGEALKANRTEDQPTACRVLPACLLCSHITPEPLPDTTAAAAAGYSPLYRLALIAP